MLLYTRTFLCLLITLMACKSSGRTDTPFEGEDKVASSNYVVLAQKALTYQADFRWDEWAILMAPDVEYFLAEQEGMAPLKGKPAVLTYWQQWPKACHIRRVSLSDFTILPLLTSRKLPLAELPGVYVSIVFNRTIVFDSGKEVRSLGCIWLHFNEDKLIDRLYGFETRVKSR